MSLVEDALASAGYTTLVFRNAQALIEAAPDAPPACILLDVGSAGNDRIADLHSLCQAFARWPVIATSAGGDPTLAARALHGGARDFIVTPLDRDELLEMVRAVSTLVD